MKVLLVEDDVKIAAMLRRGLEREGFTIETADNGVDGLWRAREFRYDVVVLDILLPGLNGYQVCRQLRESGSSTPVLILTAKSGELDEAEGLDTGADDYLTKPFSFTVLVARLRALARRPPTALPDEFNIGDVHVDTRRRRVLRCGVDVPVTSREFDVLTVLARRGDEVLSKAAILGAVWDSDFEGDPNIVEAYIARLRRKLGVHPSGGQLIETVRGAGYRMRAHG